MIKGILALFRSGLIFNPMVFLGILTGFIAMGTMDNDKLKAFYTNPGLYILMLMIAAAYVYTFKCVYITGKSDIDWKETILTMIGHFLMMVVSFIFSMLFVMVISFGGSEEKTKAQKLPEFEKIEQETQALQNEYNAIMNDINNPQLGLQ